MFLRRWLAENVPQHRLAEARFITYDSFQFMFADGRITGLLDFEHTHVGDPMMDLAALRIRDTLKNLGDLAETGARYEAATVSSSTTTSSTTTPSCTTRCRSSRWARRWPIRCPGPIGCRTSRWYVNGARWAFEVIAEIRGYQLEPVAIPDPRPTRHAPAYRHLVESLRARVRPAFSTTTSASGSVGSRTTCGASTRSARHWTPPTSTTWPRCSGTVRTRRRPTPSSSNSSHAAGPDRERGGSSASSTREHNGCT